MKFLATLSALCLAASSVTAHPVLEERQQTSGTLITAGAGGSAVYPRLEIRQMKDTKPNQYTLLVLAMRQWQQESTSNIASYFQIAGIHGVPRVNYNGAKQCGSCGGTDGYCPHDSVLFPGWHRAYVAHFEQEFLKVVNTIANSYTGSMKNTMVAAASTMRWPYFDWAAKPPSGRPVMPQIISDYSVTVVGPNGKSTTFNNPLFRFDFPSSAGLVYPPFTTWKRTYRYPNSNNADAASNTQSLINAFANTRQSLQDQVYSLFSTCKDFLHFSNDDAGSSSTQCSNSLEGIHNTVHTLCGGGGSSSVSGGHMTYLPEAAFDPIFFLHHCNVDRIFAMWQRLNPNSYGASQVAPHNTWTIAEGSTQNAGSPLTPFLKTSAAYWTTNEVKDWTVFKYTYPEFADSDGSAASITKYVNGLYGPNANKVAGSSKREAAPAPANPIAGLADALSTNPLRASNGSTFQYVANIQTPRYALNGSYQIFLFNGDPASEDPATWVFDPKLIGPMGVMAGDGMKNTNLIASGSIPLTRALQDVAGNGLLAGLTEALVVPFLAANLRWRIQGPDGSEVDPGTLDGFVCAVYASSSSYETDPNVLPAWSPFIELLDVTKGQSGGANSTQTSTV